MLTKAGRVEIDVPRDRAGTFEPAIVKKRQRRLGSIEDMVLSLSAWAMTHGGLRPMRWDVGAGSGSGAASCRVSDRLVGPFDCRQ